MSWLVSGGYVAAAVLLGRMMFVRRDGDVVARLGVVPSRAADPLAAMGGRMGALGGRTARRLRALGVTEQLDRLLGMKAALAVVGLTLGAITWGFEPAGVGGGTVLLLGGWILPDVMLARRLEARRLRTAADVPEALDLVSLAVGAGLSPRLALERAASILRGPLGEELRRAEREVALGAPWERALMVVADRTGGGAVRRLAVSLARARRLGTPLAEPLRRLALDVRAEERARSEERARRAPVVMLFPLVLCILPAFVVAAVVPAVLMALRGLE